MKRTKVCNMLGISQPILQAGLPWVSNPELVAYSREVAETLNLSIEACESPEFAEVFSGNKMLEGMDPYAMCYGGHQFGSWAGQLGDGRAINLAETVNPQGERWVLQLKGAGPTPYSRSADGWRRAAGGQPEITGHPPGR